MHFRAPFSHVFHVLCFGCILRIIFVCLAFFSAFAFCLVHRLHLPYHFECFVFFRAVLAFLLCGTNSWFRLPHGRMSCHYKHCSPLGLRADALPQVLSGKRIIVLRKDTFPNRHSVLFFTSTFECTSAICSPNTARNVTRLQPCFVLAQVLC